jgi:hypothetical protein
MIEYTAEKGHDIYTRSIINDEMIKKEMSNNGQTSILFSSEEGYEVPTSTPGRGDQYVADRICQDINAKVSPEYQVKRTCILKNSIEIREKCDLVREVMFQIAW